MIELLIVIAIIGILTAIALPAYTRYVTRTNRSEATTALLDLANKMEEYYAQNNNYGTSATTPATVGASDITQNGLYNLSISASATTYVLTATPQGAQATNDTECGSFTYNQLGERGIVTTGTGTVNTCW